MLGLQASLASQAKRGTFATPLTHVTLAPRPLQCTYPYVTSMYVPLYRISHLIYLSLDLSTSAHTLQRVLPRDVAFVVQVSYLPACLPCHVGRESRYRTEPQQPKKCVFIPQTDDRFPPALGHPHGMDPFRSVTAEKEWPKLEHVGEQGCKTFRRHV